MSNPPSLFGGLPDGWRIVPVKAVAGYFVSNVDKLSETGELPVRLCNYTDVYKNERITPQMDLMWASATAAEIERFHLEAGDVVITKDSESWDDIAVPAVVMETADDLVCGYHLAVIRPNKELLSGGYLFRCMQARPIALQMELASTGVTRYGLPKGAIGSALLPLPPRSAQDRIADYLDRETAEIDALAAEKERMLALLEEKRAALVSHAVTQGLNPDAPTKPSGLDWLGGIPAQWRTPMLKHTWASADYGISENIRGEGAVRVLRMSCIHDGDVDLSDGGEVESVDESLLLRRNDLLFNRTNSLDQVAKVGLVRQDPEMPTTFASYMVRIRTNDRTTPEFMSFLLNSHEFLSFARKKAIAAIGQANLNPSRYGETKIPLPPLSEQEQIVQSLADGSVRVVHLRESLRHSIALLRERRTALITAAVTGQIPLEEMKA